MRRILFVMSLIIAAAFSAIAQVSHSVHSETHNVTSNNSGGAGWTMNWGTWVIVGLVCLLLIVVIATNTGRRA